MRIISAASALSKRLALQVSSQNSRTSINPISSALADLKNEPWLLTPGFPASALSLHGFRVLTLSSEAAPVVSFLT